MQKKLILVASPPACGKTYVSELIAKSVDQIVYLDKDDLGELIQAVFAASGQPLDMDGAFYAANLRPAEYSTIVNIAFSTLRFADRVILNGPFLKEVRDLAYMKALKDRANRMGADLLLIWVTAPLEVCCERMKQRNSVRDLLKLENWDSYVRNTNYTPPYALVEADAVDAFMVFDTKDNDTVQDALAKAMQYIEGE